MSTRRKVVSTADEHRVDRVARRPGHVGDDHALFPEERVQERRLADVRAAEDRDPDRLVADRRLVRSRQSRDDLVEQVARAVPVERGERHRVAEPEAMELDRLEVAPRVVDLVREHDHGLARGAEDRRELLVAGGDACPGVDDEEHQVGLVHRRACLLRDMAPVGARVGLVHPAGVDEPERDAVPVAEELLAVARDTRGLVDDGGTRLRQPVDEGRLADVREADDRHRAGDLAAGRELPSLTSSPLVAGGNPSGRPSP